METRKRKKHGPPLATRSASDFTHKLTCGIDEEGIIFITDACRIDGGLDGKDEVPKAKKRYWLKELAPAPHRERKQTMALPRQVRMKI
ncbi:MAG: hypothetical protein ABIG40_03050 [Parcubacteria group bacterium]